MLPLYTMLPGMVGTDFAAIMPDKFKKAGERKLPFDGNS